jgi:mRNA-degrading endonuclease RelE of RelBE toxin-antitoxin system
MRSGRTRLWARRRGTQRIFEGNGSKGSELAYQIDYSQVTDQHLRALSARQRSLVFDVVDEQLANEPGLETRNRKPMRPNPIAPWELRIGDLRVYYDIAEEPAKLVTILAIGVKDRNQVRIGGKEFDL